MAAKRKKAEVYGVVLHKAATYMYKGLRFRRGKVAEVDLATRNHLVATGHFRDSDWQEEEPKPVPVRSRRKGRVNVQRTPEPGMLSPEGGATADPNDDGEDFDGDDEEEASEEV